MSSNDRQDEWPGRRIDFARFAEDLQRRKSEIGFTATDVPRNSGKNRTASKRLLLKAIKQSGGDW